MLSAISIPVISPSLLFLASTWWSKVEKAGILKISFDGIHLPMVYCSSESGSLQGFSYPIPAFWFPLSSSSGKIFPCAAFFPEAKRTWIIPDASLQLSSCHKSGMIFSRYFFKSLKASVDSIPFSMWTSIKETGIRCFARTSGTNCQFGKCID